MRAFLVLILLATSPLLARPAGRLTPESQQLDAWLQQASEEFDVPVEVLQAVAFVHSRWKHHIPAEAQTYVRIGDDHQQPPSYGVMGLRDDSHFGHSLRDAADAIGHAPAELKRNPQLNIRGAAALLREYAPELTRASALESWEPAVARYSGIRNPDIAQMHTYDVFNAIVRGRESDQYRVTPRALSLEAIYGAERLRVLSAPRLIIDHPTAGRQRIRTNTDDYQTALWSAAPACNYTAGRSEAVTHIAEHIAEGTYAGTIDWFTNCNAPQVSAHYLVRSADGQVTQFVREHDTAHHIGGHNSYTIGIEHEGFESNCAWYTAAMYNSSSLLTRDIADGRGIPANTTYDASQGWSTELARTSFWRIKGHTNFPTAKTCPGICFSWPRFRNLVISAGSNPYRFVSGRDQYLACYGIAGRIASNCDDIADLNDRQMCRGISTASQTPCTTITNRNLQLACYAMSINYPSNCRDITDPDLRNLCYAESSRNINYCASVTNRDTQLLCYALSNGINSNCRDITESNDRQFCYAVSSLNNAYCANITQ